MRASLYDSANKPVCLTPSYHLRPREWRHQPRRSTSSDFRQTHSKIYCVFQGQKMFGTKISGPWKSVVLFGRALWTCFMPPSHFHGWDAGFEFEPCKAQPGCFGQGSTPWTFAVGYGVITVPMHGRVEVAVCFSRVLLEKYQGYTPGVLLLHIGCARCHR